VKTNRTLVTFSGLEMDFVTGNIFCDLH